MPEQENPHAEHRKRMRERFYQTCLNSKPFDGFADHEILEMLLYFAIPRGDTNPLAHALIHHFGSLEAVFSAHIDDLTNVPGIGPKSALQIACVGGLYQHLSAKPVKKKRSVDTIEEAGKLCTEMLRGKRNECLHAICLDANFRILFAGQVGEGTVSSLPIYPRKIVELCLRYNAVSVILAHNHPGGHTQPSHADIRLTRQIIDLLKPLDIAVLDHIIIADGKYFSFISHIDPAREFPMAGKKQELMAAEENNLILD